MAERALLIGCGDLACARRLRVQGVKSMPCGASRPLTTRGRHRWLRGDISRPDGIPVLPAGITRLIFPARPPARATKPSIAACSSTGCAMCSPRWTPPICNASCSCRPAPSMANTGAAGSTRTRRPRRKASTAASCWKPRHCWQPDPNPPRRCDWPACMARRLQLIERLRSGQAGAPVEPPHWANRIHIDDAAAAVAHLALLPAVAPVYIGCDDTPLPLHELYADLARLAGAPRRASRPRPPTWAARNSATRGCAPAACACNGRTRGPAMRRCWPKASAPEPAGAPFPPAPRLSSVTGKRMHGSFPIESWPVTNRDTGGSFHHEPAPCRPPIPSPPSPTPIPIYYAALARERPLYRDDTLNLWVASSPQAIAQVLAHPPPASGRPPNPCRAACAPPRRAVRPLCPDE